MIENDVTSDRTQSTCFPWSWL